MTDFFQIRGGTKGRPAPRSASHTVWAGVQRSPAPVPVDGAAIGALAAECLILEVETWPKPGLVSHIDTGSHGDMDAALLRKSAGVLEPFFAAMASAGAEGAPMDRLRRIGMDAEAAMLEKTRGVNTHRGAIFGLGLLCAAAGLRATTPAVAATDGRGGGVALAPSRFTIVETEIVETEQAETATAETKTAQIETLGAIVRRLWARDIADGPVALHSHGTRAARLYGATGARGEAMAGFPSVYTLGLPALAEGAHLAPYDAEAVRVHALFALMAVIKDTNLLHRGGPEGLSFARTGANTFMRHGGIARHGWRLDAAFLHAEFVKRRLSPGGSADLLAMSLFVQALDGQAEA